jgi:hypothetical protein
MEDARMKVDVKKALEVLKKEWSNAGDSIPEGWMTISDLAEKMGVTDASVRSKLKNPKLKPKMFRIKATNNTLRNVKHFYLPDVVAYFVR